ncbi:MAG: hypothetical protein AAFR12_07280 [Cyanobacteria bacterium J06626_6]
MLSLYPCLQKRRLLLAPGMTVAVERCYECFDTSISLFLPTYIGQTYEQELRSLKQKLRLLLQYPELLICLAQTYKQKLRSLKQKLRSLKQKLRLLLQYPELLICLAQTYKQKLRSLE